MTDALMMLPAVDPSIVCATTPNIAPPSNAADAEAFASVLAQASSPPPTSPPPSPPATPKPDVTGDSALLRALPQSPLAPPTRCTSAHSPKALGNRTTKRDAATKHDDPQPIAALLQPQPFCPPPPPPSPLVVATPTTTKTSDPIDIPTALAVPPPTAPVPVAANAIVPQQLAIVAPSPPAIPARIEASRDVTPRAHANARRVAPPDLAPQDEAAPRPVDAPHPPIARSDRSDDVARPPPRVHDVTRRDPAQPAEAQSAEAAPPVPTVVATPPLHETAPRALEARPAPPTVTPVTVASPIERQRAVTSALNQLTIRHATHAEVTTPELGVVHVDARGAAGAVAVQLHVERYDAPEPIHRFQNDLTSYVREAAVPVWKLDVIPDARSASADSGSRGSREHEARDFDSDANESEPRARRTRRARFVL
jgi:hypothetical protein